MRAIILSVLGFTIVGAAEAGNPPPGNDIVAVRIYNYAKVSDSAISRAAAFAKRVLALAGVDSEWVIQGKGGVEKNPAETGRRNLVMRIIPNRMIVQWATEPYQLGYSLISPETGTGYIGGVHYERIRDCASVWNVDRTLILGIVLAHEAGHLLLGAGSHSAHGIMSAPLEFEHIKLASHGSLHFTENQAKTIRDSLKNNHLRDLQLAQR